MKRGSGGIRTHASEETDALNQRLRPLGHATRYRAQEFLTSLHFIRDELLVAVDTTHDI